MNAILQALKDKADMNDDGKIDKADLELAIALGNQLATGASQKATPLGAMFMVAVSSFVIGIFTHKGYAALIAWWAAF